MVHLDYNLAYYKLTQARANQLATDQERYLFVEFTYDQDNNIDLIKNVYHEKDKEGFIFKLDFTNIISGSILTVRKKFYPEELYDYVTLVLDKRFEDFYYTNQFNPVYNNIDLRIVWYFLNNDQSVDINIKYVRDSKYIFSYKKLCNYYERTVKERADIQLCCKNLGLIKDPNTNLYYCPDHFNKKK